jgi:diaminopimelate epimerase
METHFTKMHGLGNDFVVINAVTQNVLLTPHIIQQLSDRHTGIGFDQCLVVEPAKQDGIDFFYRIFNANGDEVSQCGNGARCLARFIKQENLSDKDILTVATHSSIMQLKIEDNKNVLVDMGSPKLLPEEIPLDSPNQSDYYPFEVSGEVHYLHAVNVGNPHGVMIVDEITDELVANLGEKLSVHPLFPEGANISFVELIDSETILLRVYERGVGETRACGSAAVAASICVRLFHEGADLIKVNLPGGSLSVYWKEPDTTIKCQGPAVSVFKGVVDL